MYLFIDFGVEFTILKGHFDITVIKCSRYQLRVFYHLNKEDKTLSELHFNLGTISALSSKD